MIVRLKQLYALVLLVGAISSVSFAARQTAVAGTPAPLLEDSGAQAGELRKVKRVVDGDTIVVYPNEKVRLIGVDTPETVHPEKTVQCFGNDAKRFTRDAVEGKTVRLALDSTNAKRGHKDRYGRTLAYAYLDDGRMLNRELIRQGYAHAYTRFPFSHLVEFRQLERTARANSLGLWASCPIE